MQEHKYKHTQADSDEYSIVMFYKKESENNTSN